ncbi:MAG: hypothetical protein Q4G60_12830 [bacterium]|nr:hypothetical protein [bacterium]
MELRKTWFSYLTIGIFLIGIALILLYGFGQFRTVYYYSYIVQGILVFMIGGLWLLMRAVFKVGTRFRVYQWFDSSLKRGIVLEALIVIVLITVGVLLRVWVIQTIPMDMESDFLYYYNIAVNIVNGTLEESGQVDYLAMSPNGYGYPYLLSRLMILFRTTSRSLCFVTMTVAQAITMFACYRIGRKLGGRVAGLAALAIIVFWPSQILYSDFNGTEAVSTCFLYVGVLLFVHIMNDFTEHTVKPVWIYSSHIILGVLLELSAAIRPVATIFLIAAVLCMLPSGMKLKYKDSNNVPICTRFLAKGWLRALVILLSYMMCSNVVNSHISYQLGRDIGGGGVTYGYSLATGLNRDTKGGYSEEVSQIMKDIYYETGSSAEAGAVLLDRAVSEIKNYPIPIINLIFEKYEMLWANDDYGISSNITSLNAQRKLTQEWDDWLSGQRMLHNFYYFTFVTYAGLCGIYLWKRKSNTAQVLVLFFVGAIALHSLIEVQNRYHYYMLQTFAILSGIAIGYLYQDCKSSALRVMSRQDFPQEPISVTAVQAMPEFQEVQAVQTAPEFQKILVKTVPGVLTAKETAIRKLIKEKNNIAPGDFDLDALDETLSDFDYDEYGNPIEQPQLVQLPIAEQLTIEPKQLNVVTEEAVQQESEEGYLDADVEPEEDHTKFNMNEAIKEHHVRVTATRSSEGSGGLRDVDLRAGEN